MKTCTICKVPQKVSAFYMKKAVAGGKNYPSSYCKKCDKKRIHDRLKNLRLYILELLGGKCMKCGYSRCIQALDVHHRNMDEKEFQISRFRSMSDNLKRELMKCDLLCATCHREAHFMN